jgi:hypothetical protein
MKIFCIIIILQEPQFCGRKITTEGGGEVKKIKKSLILLTTVGPLLTQLFSN